MNTANKHRLYVDCQVFQYNTWNRGMGRYTLKLLEALDKEDVELTLILNKNIGIEKKRIKIISDTCPSAKILFLKLSEDPNRVGGWRKLQEICAAELDEQLEGILKPSDTYLIASNFALRYCSTFPNIECQKSLIFYDLTPYLHWGDYRKTPDFEPKKYFAQFKTVFRADKLWAISESAAEEAKYWLGIDGSKVQNIRGASIRNLHEKPRRPDAVLETNFLLCPSADGPNKNNENMVRAFAEFNKKAGGKYKLVITSDFSNQSKATLGTISTDIIFAGYVTDGELSWLYKNCEALLFVSKTEGLGLPILEAVGAGKKVICSDIKVFREISEEAFYFADPNNIQSISDALNNALISEDNWINKNKLYPSIGRIFSWPAVAKTCIEMMNDIKTASDNENNQQKIINYADSDHESIARDLAEILYPHNYNAEFLAMRALKYQHNQPSYLVEMGVAINALDEAKESISSTPLYIVDDSAEGAQLLLYAIQSRGIIVATYEKDSVPSNVEKFIKQTFDNKLTHKSFFKLLEIAGNKFLYKSEFSKRGSAEFIEQVAELNRQLLKMEDEN
jgi:glycosyltransferase involved in cell wall biosynthesis